MAKNILMKTLLLAGLVFILAFCVHAENVYADGNDKDDDGLITFTELSREDQDMVRKGYSPGGKFGFEKIFMMDDPYLMDLSDGHSLNVPYYHLMSRRAICYYRRAEVRNDERLYPRETTGWFVTSTWSEDGEDCAAVNCTAHTSKLKTPETIRYDGNTYKVTALDLSNTDVCELTITDNIETIRRCQCPRLRTIKGGRFVRAIGKKGFMNCMSLVNMPYFPSLSYIGEFAFLGCLNLKDVSLPGNIQNIYWNAFGWYDVVLGNYDTDAPREDFWADFDEEDPEYRLSGIYNELEKRKNMTLYAAKDTLTWTALEETFGAGNKKCAHVAYKEKTAYPGDKPTIDLDREIEEEVEKWLPKDLTLDDIDWGEKRAEEVSAEKPVVVNNALTEGQKECVEWLLSLVIAEKIDIDMMLNLLGSMCGLNPVPIEFASDRLQDPYFPLLIIEHTKGSLQNDKAYQAAKASDKAKSEVITHDLFTQQYNLMIYAVTYLDYLKTAGAEVFAEKFKVAVPEILKTTSNIATVFNHLNRFFGYVEKGDSWLEAGGKALTTSVYLKKAQEALARGARPVLFWYEVCSFVLLGTSDAGDAASPTLTGMHAVEAVSDFVLTPVIEGWYASSNCPDDAKWDVFFTVWKEQFDTFVFKLFDTQERYYGQNVTNYFYLERAWLNFLFGDGEIYRSIFSGYVEQFKAGSLFSWFLEDTYNVVVKNNRLMEALEDAVLDQWFIALMTDFVVTYYSGDPTVLKDRIWERYGW